MFKDSPLVVYGKQEVILLFFKGTWSGNFNGICVYKFLKQGE
jgi:hypothetical protein